MSIESNTALVRSIFEAGVNRGEVDAIYAATHPDFFDHDIHVETSISSGPDDLREAILNIRKGFPDIKVTIHQVIAAGDFVVTRNTWVGTHLGAFNGIAPTGNKIEISGIVIWRLEDGMVRERWATIDNLTLLRQMNVIRV